MDAERRKALKEAYAEKPVIGGIYSIKCSGNNRTWIKYTRDLESVMRRYKFAISMNGAPEPAMQKECVEYGAGSFSFTVLEELKKGKDQTDQEYYDDIKALYEIWLEKEN